MKKLYTLLIACFAVLLIGAQTDVTFNVDMNNQTVSEMGVHIAGSFNAEGANPEYPDWTPGAIELLDDNSDGIYSVTLQLQSGTYEFKYLNGNEWGTDEGIPPACQASGSLNRIFEVLAMPSSIDPVCFGECAMCGMKSIKFNVDMTTQSEVSPAGVHLAHNIFEAGGIFDPAEWVTMEDQGNGNWSVLVSYDPTMAPDPIEYRYINGNQIGNPAEELVGTECGNANGNREIAAFADATMTTSPFCFSECTTCAQPQSLTIRVDMTQEAVSVDGVHVAGNFETGDTGNAVNPYPNWDPAGIELTDDDSDMIFEVTLSLVPANYEFKVVNGNAWGFDEAVPSDCATNNNRSIEVLEGEDPITTFCFAQCSEECTINPEPANITFQVEMTGTTISADGVFLIGSFTEPQWQDGAVLLTDLGNDIYSATVLVSGQAEIQYKFVNGDVDIVANEEGPGIGDGGCGIDNGFEGFNRTHERSGLDETLPLICYDSCEPCFINVSEIGKLFVDVYPNPVDLVVNIELPNGRLERLEMTDATGRVVENLSVTVDSGKLSIPVEQLSSGVYILTMTIDGQLISGRFLKR